MAGAVADRAWRTTVPERIEADLAALWREMAGGDARVARAVMSNLVVFRDRVAPADADLEAIVAGLPLDEVAARHPSRIIVLEHCHGAAAGAPFSAGVGITTFGPPQARYGVERIVVRSACPDEALLSILRRFLRGDLPTSVWWTEDMSAAPALEAFVEVGRQLVYDSRGWHDVAAGVAAVVAVIAGERIDPADLNWRRLAPLRRALVHARGPLSSPAWQQVPVRIVAAAGEDALAWLCAGWLRAARSEQDRAAVVIESGSASEPDRSASPSGERDLLLTVYADNLTATLTARGARVEGAEPPLVVTSPLETDADAIAAELRTLARDTALIAALRALASTLP
jgi:glucose-6-phosphate dehydrogenase assembly protein OpcA